MGDAREVRSGQMGNDERLGDEGSGLALDCLDPGRVVVSSRHLKYAVGFRYKGACLPPLGQDHHRSSAFNSSHRLASRYPSQRIHCSFPETKMHSKIAAFLLPLLAVATPVPQSGTAPDPSQITILDSSYSGNGCPQGSVSTSTSPDKTVSCSSFLSTPHVPQLLCLLRAASATP